LGFFSSGMDSVLQEASGLLLARDYTPNCGSESGRMPTHPPVFLEVLILQVV
jgi:hypothetical protein